jgi:hypothetical protein
MVSGIGDEVRLMNWFWITGIVVNVALTVLGIVWVVRQGKPKGGAAKDREGSSS